MRHRIFNNHVEFATFCDNLAKKLSTKVKIKTYEDFHFSTATFMTDNFGGSYANIKFDWDSLEVVNTFGNVYKPYEGETDLIISITTAKVKLEASRDLNAVYERVNDEY